MNREQAKGVVKHFEAVKAFAEGKTIQIKGFNDNWIDFEGGSDDHPLFQTASEYRVKPEPRTIRLWLLPDGYVSASRYSWMDGSREDPDQQFTKNTTLVEFVEVIKP